VHLAARGVHFAPLMRVLSLSGGRWTGSPARFCVWRECATTELQSATMIVNILQHTPVWVWALFCALQALGFSQTRTQEVSKARVTVLPLAMVCLSISGLLGSFGQLPVAWAAWIAGFVITMRLLAPVVAARGATWSAEAQRFWIPGSWVPLTLILGLFVLKYLAGAGMALNPSLATNGVFAGTLSFLYGMFAGLFWGRARSLRALMRESALAQPARVR
jgi:hypothetical protein